jgi:hypothetical protein
MTMDAGYRPPGARYEIRVAGVARTMRDRREAAIEAARALALRDPRVELIDLADGAVVPFEKPAGAG